jgi:hypothetical protein
MSPSFLNACRRKAKQDAPRARVFARQIPRLIGFFAVLMLPWPAFADPGVPAIPIGKPSKAPSPNNFVTVSHLGESDQQAAARNGQLLSHHRTTDPFGATIRGPYKGLPPVVEHPVAATGQPTATTPAVYVPTLSDAINGLSIGAVNVGAHEFLIGSRSIREGDLMVLASGSSQFLVWVQSVGVRGVWFCDIDMQKQLLKPFGYGPKELPEDSVRGTQDTRHFLNNASQ